MWSCPLITALFVIRKRKLLAISCTLAGKLDIFGGRVSDGSIGWVLSLLNPNVIFCNSLNGVGKAM